MKDENSDRGREMKKKCAHFTTNPSPSILHSHVIGHPLEPMSKSWVSKYPFAQIGVGGRFAEPHSELLTKWCDP